jgi:aconitate hydratase
MPEIAAAVKDNNIVGTSVLSGNRNFEGRIHALVQHNFLASPPLVVAYAIAGNMDFDLLNDSLGDDQDGNPVYMKNIWPTQAEVQDAVVNNIDSTMFKSSYDSVFEGDANWKGIDSPEGEIYTWDADSTYVKNPPYFEGMSKTPTAVSNIEGARALALLGDSVTTDHISPAGGIALDSPAAEYLKAQGVEPHNFNSYGSRRGNHEVMMRGTFANIRLRNLLAPGTEGGWTCHQPSGEQMSIFDASLKYRTEGTPLVVIAGSEYGTGSSRDWAAKGTVLLGVKAVIAKSFERIHRSNLIGMGVLPLQFMEGQDAMSLGLTGTEIYAISGQTDPDAKTVKVTVTSGDGHVSSFEALVRIDTPKERDYYENGGILHYVLRQLAA